MVRWTVRIGRRRPVDGSMNRAVWPSAVRSGWRAESRPAGRPVRARGRPRRRSRRGPRRARRRGRGRPGRSPGTEAGRVGRGGATRPPRPSSSLSRAQAEHRGGQVGGDDRRPGLHQRLGVRVRSRSRGSGRDGRPDRRTGRTSPALRGRSADYRRSRSSRPRGHSRPGPGVPRRCPSVGRSRVDRKRMSSRPGIMADAERMSSKKRRDPAAKGRRRGREGVVVDGPCPVVTSAGGRCPGRERPGPPRPARGRRRGRDARRVRRGRGRRPVRSGSGSARPPGGVPQPRRGRGAPVRRSPGWPGSARRARSG